MVGQAVKGTRLDESLHLPLVQILARKPLQKVLKGGKGLPLPLVQDGAEEGLAHILQREQSVTDVPATPRFGDVEVHLTFVDVGGQHLDAVLAALGGILRHLGLITQHRGEQGGKVRPGVMGLQVGGTVGDQGIGGGVGLVEGVVGKAAHVVEELFRLGVGHAVLFGTRHEISPLGLQHGGLLLGHGAADDVGVAVGVSRHDAEDAHDLLLVHRHAVGRGQNGLQEGGGILDLRRIFPIGDVAGNGLHGAGTIQGDGGLNVPDSPGLQTRQHLPHASRFQLEHTQGLTTADQLVGLGIVQGDTIQAEGGIGLLHLLLGVVHDGEVAQSQKVKFQNAQLGYGVHVVLGDGGAVVDGQGHEITHGSIRNDDTRGVNRGIAGHALQRHGGIHQLLDLLRPLVESLEVGQAQRLLDGDAQLLGHSSGHHVYVGVAHAHGATHVTDGGASSQRTEGNDLRHVIAAVLVGHVGYDLVPSVVAKIHVDIRHGHPLGIEEALKEKIKGDGIHLSDADTVGDQGACARSTTGAHGDTLGLGEVDVVLHDEEVVVVAHAANDPQLVGDAVTVGDLGMLTVIVDDLPLPNTARKSLLGEAGQVLPCG